MERVRLRTARVSDAAALLAIYAPYVRETAITFEYDVPDEREFAARIRHVLESFLTLSRKPTAKSSATLTRAHFIPVRRISGAQR